MGKDKWDKIRLSEEQIKEIKRTAYEVFGKEIKIYIFGSRVILEKRGGDIDILIKTSRKISVDEKLTFLARLELRGISRKVDLLIISPDVELKGIYQEALRTGVEI